MSLFSPTKDAPPAVTGVDVLRRTLYARLAKGALAQIASNISGVGIAALEDFARGHGQLSPAILSLLAKELFGNHVELSETGMLRSANREEPTPFATAIPPQWDPSAHPPVPLTASTNGKPPKPVPPRQPRPGWE